MEVKAGYKQTDIGVIPEDWQVKPLTGLAAILHGFGFQSQYFTSFGNFRLTTPGHFHEEGGFRDLGDKQKYYDGPLPSGYLLNKGDMIVAMTEQADGLLGSAALVPISGTYLHNQRLGKVKILSSELSIRYLYLVFNSRGYRAKVRETAAGTKVKHTSPTKLLEIPIPIPPTIAEQEAIAEALSDADALIEALEQLLAKKRQVKQGAMQELLTGKRRLPGFSGKWEVKTLGELGEITGAGVDKKIRSDEEPVRLVNYLDVYHRDFIYSKDLNHWVSAPSAQLKRCAVRKGDIFFTPSSEMPYDIAISAIAMEDISDAAYSYHVVRLRLNEENDWNLAFRTYIFKTRYFLSQAETMCEGSGKRYVITLKRFRELKVYFPSDVKEQTAIAEILSDMDAEIAALEGKLSKAREVKAGMMSVLLTGKVRLKPKP